MQTIVFRSHHAFYFLGPLGVAANVSYAGMRAQNNPDTYWHRKIAFWLGFPTILVTFLLVEEGSQKAFGVDLPRMNHVVVERAGKGNRRRSEDDK